jgi:hypothetical protein
MEYGDVVDVYLVWIDSNDWAWLGYQYSAATVEGGL